MNNGEKGILFVISGPSGVGKSTIISSVLKECDSLEFSVSYTTRKARKGEENGKDYFFITREEFEDMQRRGDFLEWAEVHGNLYGTSKHFVEEALKQGKNLILDIDVQGAMNVKKIYPDEVYIFIYPPTLEQLKIRLAGRRTESEKQLARRLEDAKKELTYMYLKEFKYIVLNEDLETAILDIQSIVEDEIRKRRRKKKRKKKIE
ncbi:MAG: guanylate kinase [Thermotoga sp.]|nr:guanylate kinase [Thermotogota bacterium]RKX51839.1 MAG: guanylate kinase [Thermotoga sp.]